MSESVKCESRDPKGSREMKEGSQAGDVEKL